MRILYHVFIPNTIYAGRSIFKGYENAFKDLGHCFKLVGIDSDLEKEIYNYSPDILFTFLGSISFKFQKLKLIKNIRKKGVKVFVNISYWNSPFKKTRLNESASLSKIPEIVKIIKSGEFGDIYYNVCEQDDLRMDGFYKATGYNYYTILLAADKILNYPEYSNKYKADISYVGTNLPGKRKYFKENIFPLRKKYDVKIYGQDWNYKDKITGIINKAGWYCNLPFLRNIQKPSLNLEEERRIYSSSVISINIHEEYQLKMGGECNERTFKIPLCGGFEICDNVACVKKYFKNGEEIIIANNKKELTEMIEYYYRNPEKRIPTINAGRKRVLRDHTYHNRVNKFIEIYKELK